MTILLLKSETFSPKNVDHLAYNFDNDELNSEFHCISLIHNNHVVNCLEILPDFNPVYELIAKMAKLQHPWSHGLKRRRLLFSASTA